MEVTDKMIEIACKAAFAEPISKFRRQDMKAALEAVFASIPEKPDSSIFNSFPPELPIMPEDRIALNEIPSDDEYIKMNRDAIEALGAWAGAREIKPEDNQEADYKKAYKQNLDLNNVPQNPNRIKLEKKIYKFSEMWIGWYYYNERGIIQTLLFENKKEVVDHTGMTTTLLAITRADATEFYEGEGLISEYLEGRCG